MKSPAPEQKSGGPWVYSEANFARFEDHLRRCGRHGKSEWRLRSEIFGTLALPHPTQALRYRFGYAGVLFFEALQWARAWRASASLPHLPAAYVLFVAGNESKEIDMARSLVPEIIRQGQTVTILHGSPSDKPSAFGMEFPDQYQPFSGPAYYRISGLSLLRCMGRALVAMLKLLWLAPAIPGMAARLLRQRGAELLHAYVEQFVGEQFFVRQFGAGLRGIALVSEGTPVARALVTAAHKWGACSFHFIHGFPHPQHAASDSDHVFCFSRVDRHVFLSNGWPETFVHACGHCRSGIIMRDIVARRRAMCLDEGIRILFAEQCLEGPYDAACYDETITSMLEAAVKAGLSPHELRIRIHPRSDRARVLAIASRVGFCNSEQYLSTHPLADDLAWANVIATAWSTIAVEAAWAKACLIWLPMGSFRFEIREGLQSEGYGIEGENAQALVNCITRLRDAASRRKMAEDMQTVAHKLAIVSPAAVSDSVQAMLRASPRPCGYASEETAGV